MPCGGALARGPRAPILVPRMSDHKPTRPPRTQESTHAEFDTPTSPSGQDLSDIERVTTIRDVAPGRGPEAPLTPPLDPSGAAIGQQLCASGARYVDAGEIARGGMSSVHRSFDSLLLRAVAMKALRKDRKASELTRFIEEAQITGQLDHPNIVPVYDMQIDERGVPSRLMMKMVQGKTLHEVAHEGADEPLAGARLEALLQVLVKVCDAVAFAHSRGVIHRDLKPGNIMVGTHGQVYVMDWGIALVRHGLEGSETRAKLPTIQVGTPGATAEAHGSLSGTPAYMAPEQALGLIDSIDERTDTYGLGGVLYYLMTLTPPHSGGSVAADLELAKFTPVTPPNQLAADRLLPPGLCRIVMRALSEEPDERYQTADAMKADLEGFLRGGGWLEQRRFKQGTVLIEEGADADCAYIITDGHCELHKKVNGQRRFIRLMGAGEAFGETAIFGSTPRTATVIASTDVAVLVATRAALEHELDRNVWVRSFVEAMAERFVELDRKAARLEQELAKLRAKQ